MFDLGGPMGLVAVILGGSKVARELESRWRVRRIALGPEPKADGMMAGVVPGAGKSESKKKLLPVTPWGRYLKVLLSSSEFLFVS